MRIATIDLGSNTVRLLVVETEGCGRWRTLEEAQTVTRLGEGLALSGRLGEAPAARTAGVVARYAATANRLGADTLVIVATSAVREAANGAEFARHVAAQAGHPVRVVPGDVEARLALRGVMHGLGAMTGSVLVFDIGGGSTEFIRAREGVLEAAVSLRLGVVPLVERFQAYDEIATHVRARLAAELPPHIMEPAPDLLVGTAGTVTTLAALDLGLRRYDATRVQSHRLTRAAVEAQLTRLRALSVAQRAALPCLEPGRADVIIPGTAILLETMTAARADALVVSDYGVREGILAEALDGHADACRGGGFLDTSGGAP